jgi:NAD(P)-dependent dehydrogenase (short-subunit alcohol dehydrogenase family)
MRLKNKVAVITGCAGGIGSITAERFAEEGSALVLTDINRAAGEVLSEKIQAAGGKAIFIAADITSAKDWDTVRDAALSHYGQVDILINNAGISNLRMEDTTSIEDWHTLMEVNSTSVFLGSRTIIPAMIESGGGAIVNVSSLYGILGSPGHPGYHASKGAIRAYTKATAVTYGPQGIRANSVHPGVMQPMTSGGATDEGVLEMRKAFARMTPMQRMGESVEVANAMLFLASDEASYITGSELIVDGGLMAQ